MSFPLDARKLPHEPEPEWMKRRRLGTSFWFVWNGLPIAVWGYDLTDAIDEFKRIYPNKRGTVRIHDTGSGFPNQGNVIREVEL